jgi:hypothetical protein
MTFCQLHDLIVKIIASITSAGITLAGSFASLTLVSTDSACTLAGVTRALAVADSAALPLLLLLRCATTSRIRTISGGAMATT